MSSVPLIQIQRINPSTYQPTMTDQPTILTMPQINHQKTIAENDKRVVVGLSGGVDSSVATYLLQQQGYDVQALFMKNWEEDDDDEYCSAAVDLKDSINICDALGITLHTRNFSTEYWDKVFRYFLIKKLSSKHFLIKLWKWELITLRQDIMQELNTWMDFLDS